MVMITFLIKQIGKMGMQHVVLPLAYALFCLRPCDDRAVLFADVHHDSRPESMDRLYTFLQAEGGWKLQEFYCDFGKQGLVRQLMESIRFMKAYAAAGTVVLCDNCLPASSCRKRKGTRVVQLWHGPGAFKKFGYDAKDDIPAFYHGNVYKNYDLVTVSGPACVGPFSSAMRQADGVVQALGIPRMDEYREPDYAAACRKKFFETYPQAAGKKILLWAPTFRGNAASPVLAGEAEVDDLAKALGDDWFVVKSLHPHMLHAQAEQGLTTAQMLPAADVFVTDYSSVMYDACLLGCRMVMFAPDLQEYMSGRGTYLDLEEFPGEVVADPARLKEAVLKAETGYDFEKQNAFNDRYLSACDGGATERIAEQIRAWHGGAPRKSVRKNTVKSLGKSLILKGLFPVYYVLCAMRRPVHRKVLFLEIRYPVLTDNLRRLYDAYVSEGKYRTETFFLQADGGSLAYIKRSLAMIRVISDAKLVYVDESSNVLAALPLRPKTKVIQAWHACGAFKRFGHGLLSDTAEGYYGKYDLVTVSAEDIVPIYEESMRQRPGVVRATGVSRTDAFFEPDRAEVARAAIEDTFPVLKGKKLVLFAPTFRGNVADAKSPELPDILCLRQELGEACVFFFRGHPAVKEAAAVPESCREFFLDVTEDTRFSTEDYLCAADICITDYSSLVFDFSLFERPMLFYAYDYEQYDDERGFYFPYREFIPGPLCRTTEDLICEMKKVLAGDWDRERVRAFRQRFMGACDGQATKRIKEAAERL